MQDNNVDGRRRRTLTCLLYFSACPARALKIFRMTSAVRILFVSWSVYTVLSNLTNVQPNWDTATSD